MLWVMVACGRIGVEPIPAGGAGAVRPDAGSTTRDAGKVDAGAANGGADAATDSGADAAADGGEPVCPMSCENAHGSADCGTGQCQIGCELGYADCDDNVQNGCETSTVNEVMSCGGCAIACSNPQGVIACTQGVCVPTCNAGSSGDCDGNVQNGCETNLATDTLSCGSCGKSCTNLNGTTSCVAGTCTPVCAAGFGDCDGSANNGCETVIESDPAHCGGCGVSCDTSFQTCVNGMCRASMCPQGRGDCDANPADCETDLTTKLADCGFCGNVCMVANATPQCVGGMCDVASCKAGFGDCDDAAANGCEVPLATTAAHCGSCTAACSNAHGSTACSAGTCVPTCSVGYGTCDGNALNGCETALNTTSNCGSCGNVCPNAVSGATAVCNAGICGYSCNALAGVYALRIDAQATWPAKTYIRSGSGTLQFWLRVTLSQSGTALTGSVQLCDQTTPPTANSATSDRYLLDYPDALFTPGAPAATFSATLASLAPSSSLSSTKTAHLLGLTMTDPLNGAWPSLTTVRSNQVDVDADGEVGITTPFISNGTYSHAQTAGTLTAARASSIYGAQRLRFSLAGALTGCTGASGSATVQSFDTKTIGCRLESNQDCNSSQYGHIDDNAAVYTTGSSTYSMTKLGATGSTFTCAQVRAAL